MRDRLPPQRQGGGAGTGRAARNNLSPKEGAEEAERRLGRPCFHAGQKVVGRHRCVTCQFQIMNRGTLPVCPDCGEIVWAYMEEGPRPVPEGESHAETPAAAKPATTVQEGVKLEGPARPVKVEENVKLEP
jgi:predicted RNA-binding Zn-ribbon protein involved in translation (DUF1610 family)